MCSGTPNPGQNSAEGPVPPQNHSTRHHTLPLQSQFGIIISKKTGDAIAIWRAFASVRRTERRKNYTIIGYRDLGLCTAAQGSKASKLSLIPVSQPKGALQGALLPRKSLRRHWGRGTFGDIWGRITKIAALLLV
jgi:hypothetical protein